MSLGHGRLENAARHMVVGEKLIAVNVDTKGIDELNIIFRQLNAVHADGLVDKVDADALSFGGNHTLDKGGVVTVHKVACLVKNNDIALSGLVKEIAGANTEEVLSHIDYYQNYCDGASRKGANGARAKLEYVKEPVKNGTTVIIANSRYKISEILNGNAPSTKIIVK